MADGLLGGGIDNQIFGAIKTAFDPRLSPTGTACKVHSPCLFAHKLVNQCALGEHKNSAIEYLATMCRVRCTRSAPPANIYGPSTTSITNHLFVFSKAKVRGKCDPQFRSKSLSSAEKGSLESTSLY